MIIIIIKNFTGICKIVIRNGPAIYCNYFIDNENRVTKNGGFVDNYVDRNPSSIFLIVMKESKIIVVTL